MKINITFFFFFIGALSLKAATYQVGSGRTYASPNALYLAGVVQDGDRIEIDAETYSGTATLAYWGQDDLVLIGVGGQPVLKAAGQNMQGKAIWVVEGNNITVENIKFQDCVVPDDNGAGIRIGPGVDITIRRCTFYNNQDGILSSSPGGVVLIEYCEFDSNGGHGLVHNLYINKVDKLIFRYNYSHHARVGHNLKSRAKENYILYNRIMDEATGNSSRLIDLPNGGFSVVMGNVLMQGQQAPNNNMVGYGLEGILNDHSPEFYLINNTFLNKRTASCRFLHIDNNTTTSEVRNNIFAGTGTIVQGPITSQSNNIAEPVYANLNFLDEANYDYHLTSSSPVIDLGAAVSDVNNVSLTPDASYVHPTDFEVRTLVGPIDVGAYEYVSSSLSLTENELQEALLYPNPTKDILIIKSKNPLQKVVVYNSQQQIVYEVKNQNILDLGNLPNGVYFLKMTTSTGHNFSKKIIKN